MNAQNAFSCHFEGLQDYSQFAGSLGGLTGLSMLVILMAESYYM